MSVSAPEKFGGLVFGFDHGEEASRGSSPCVCVWGGGVCPGMLLMASWHAEEATRIRDLTHPQSPREAASSPEPPKSRRWGKERREKGVQVCFQVQNHLAVSN